MNILLKLISLSIKVNTNQGSRAAVISDVAIILCGFRNGWQSESVVISATGICMY